MRDTNFAIRKAYITALTGIVYEAQAVPVFYNEAPDTNTATNYIIIYGLSSSDQSTLNSTDNSLSVNVKIISKSLKSNSGRAGDDIAGIVLTRIKPNPAASLNLTADSLQCVSTKLTNDFTQDYGSIGGFSFADRILTFSHAIVQF